MGRGAAATAVLLAGCAAAACGSAKTPSPTTLLAEAHQTVDASSSVHFVVTSTGVTGSGTDITGGEGDIGRPDLLRGTFRLTINGLNVSVKVLAGHGRFYAEAPFQTTYVATDPSTYGVGNPADLLDPTTGLSSLLSNIQAPHSDGRSRIDGELVDKVTGTVPGSKIPSVLPDATPSAPVVVSALIDPSSHQVRQFVLTGPFTSTAPSTYTVTLTGYGEPVTVDLPH